MTQTELRDDGWTPWRIDQAVKSGRLTRLRKGWYARPGADSETVRAVRAGGVLGCASALRMHGVWVPESKDTHVRTSRELDPWFDWIRSCPADRRQRRPKTAVDPLPIALSSALRCLTPEYCIVVLDSILHQKLLTEDEVRAVVETTRGRGIRLLEQCDARAESGTETLVRVRLRAQGLDVHPQVSIAGVGRVDLLVGDRLVIEVDSREHHTSDDSFTTDRTRDLRLLAMGYVVVRLTYGQIVHSWRDVEPWLLNIIDRREHLNSPHRPRGL